MFWTVDFLYVQLQGALVDQEGTQVIESLKLVQNQTGLFLSSSNSQHYFVQIPAKLMTIPSAELVLINKC